MWQQVFNGGEERDLIETDLGSYLLRCEDIAVFNGWLGGDLPIIVTSQTIG